MRVLVVHPGPHFSVADVYRGWVKGLIANGCQVAEYNLHDRLTFYGNAHIKRGQRYKKAFRDDQVLTMAAQGLKASVYDWWPDVLLVVSAFFIPESFYPVFSDRGHRLVLLHTESPYQDDGQLDRAQYADLNILNDPTNLERFQAVAPTVYIPHAYDPALHHPRPPDPDCVSDFCFVGTGYPSRVRFLEQVDWSGLDVAFAGNWQATEEDSPLRAFLTHELDECCPNEETVKLYTSTKVSANLYRREAERPELSDGWAMGPREVELAACGTFFLREPRGEGDEVLSMLPTFTEPGEFGDLVRWWAKDDERREFTTRQAQRAVASRTFENHAAQLLRLLEKTPGRRAG